MNLTRQNALKNRGKPGGNGKESEDSPMDSQISDSDSMEESSDKFYSAIDIGDKGNEANESPNFTRLVPLSPSLKSDSV